jgi:hypothetical protein
MISITCDKIYSVNAKAFHIYRQASGKNKKLFVEQLFTRSNRTIEDHKNLVQENLEATNDSDTR